MWKNSFEMRLILVCLLLLFCSDGCMPKDGPRESKASPDTVYDEAGVKAAIEDHYGDTFGQIVTYVRPDNLNAVCVITVTMPRPDYNKVWLVREDDDALWRVEHVAKSYPYGEE
jgi:hypothetical protein